MKLTKTKLKELTYQINGAAIEVHKNLIVVELKSVERLIPLHESQLLTYMKLLNAPKGILLNFNCSHLFSEGQKTFVGKTYQWLED